MCNAEEENVRGKKANKQKHRYWSHIIGTSTSTVLELSISFGTLKETESKAATAHNQADR